MLSQISDALNEKLKKVSYQQQIEEVDEFSQNSSSSSPLSNMKERKLKKKRKSNLDGGDLSESQYIRIDQVVPKIIEFQVKRLIGKTFDERENNLRNLIKISQQHFQFIEIIQQEQILKQQNLNEDPEKTRTTIFTQVQKLRINEMMELMLKYQSQLDVIKSLDKLVVSHEEMIRDINLQLKEAVTQKLISHFQDQKQMMSKQMIGYNSLLRSDFERKIETFRAITLQNVQKMLDEKLDTHKFEKEISHKASKQQVEELRSKILDLKYGLMDRIQSQDDAQKNKIEPSQFLSLILQFLKSMTKLDEIEELMESKVGRMELEVYDKKILKIQERVEDVQRELFQKILNSYIFIQIEDLPVFREKSRSLKSSSSVSGSQETSEMLETVSDLDIESEMKDKVPDRDGSQQHTLSNHVESTHKQVKNIHTNNNNRSFTQQIFQESEQSFALISGANLGAKSQKGLRPIEIFSLDSTQNLEDINLLRSSEGKNWPPSLVGGDKHNLELISESQKAYLEEDEEIILNQNGSQRIEEAKDEEIKDSSSFKIQRDSNASQNQLDFAI